MLPESDFEQIDAILNARSMAIVGASRTPGKFGTSFTASQLAFGFIGPVYLVNPGESEILGHRVYPDLRALPEVPDLVCLTVPAHVSIDVLRQAAECRVKGVVIMAAGFREIGPEGAALEAEALRLAREGGFRIIGPNCFGLYNPRNRLTLLPGADFSTTPGPVAFVSQSGGLATHVARLGTSLGIDFSAVVSYGNGADLNEADLIGYFGRDPQTRVIAAYLEGARDGRRFFRALREAATCKPVVIWKVGKSTPSARAAASHTGSLAGEARIWEGVFRQCGVIEVSGVEELCDTLLALEHLGRRPGRRLLLMGGGGGLGTDASDVADAEELEVPPLEAETFGRLHKILNRAGAVAGNPLDIGGPLIPLPAFEVALREAARNPTTDVLVFDLAINAVHRMLGEAGLQQAADLLVRVRREVAKPVVSVLYSRAVGSGDLVYEEVLRRLRDSLHGSGIPVYPSMRRALRALALANR